MYAKIEYRIAPDTLGDTRESEAYEYASAVADALRHQFPDAHVTVNLNSRFANEAELLIKCEGDDTEMRATIHDIARFIWDGK